MYCKDLDCRPVSSKNRGKRAERGGQVNHRKRVLKRQCATYGPKQDLLIVA